MTNHQDREQIVSIRLRHALQALALPAHIQLQLLPDGVCTADELALDFDHWFTTSQGHARYALTPLALSPLVALDILLTSMSGAEQHELWTDDALVHRPEWEHVRTLAHTALSVLGWPLEIPPASDHEFIAGCDMRQTEW